MHFTSLTVLGDSGKEYVISLRGDTPVCSCPAFMFRPGPCKHMEFAASQLAAAKGVQNA